MQTHELLCSKYIHPKNENWLGDTTMKMANYNCLELNFSNFLKSVFVSYIYVLAANNDNHRNISA